MKLWRLDWKRMNDSMVWPYDVVHVAVVRAETPEAACTIIGVKPEEYTCVELTVEGPAEAICIDILEP